LLLERAASGRPDEQKRLWGIIYPQLREIAASLLSTWDGKVSLLATEVANEAFVRLFEREAVTAQGRRYFFTCCATECRRVIVDYWRKKKTDKRSPPGERLAPTEAEATAGPAFDPVALSDAIEALARNRGRAAIVVDLLVFGAMTAKQCAETLAVSERTVQGDWAYAKAWLRREMAR